MLRKFGRKRNDTLKTHFLQAVQGLSPSKFVFSTSIVLYGILKISTCPSLSEQVPKIVDKRYQADMQSIYQYVYPFLTLFLINIYIILE